MGLDLVEIVMGWEQAFGIEIPDDEAFNLRTPRMAIDLIARKLGATDEPKPCLTLRAFNRLRVSFVSVAAVDRRSFRPAAELKDLVARHRWAAIRCHCGIASLPKPGRWHSPRTVGELTRWTVINAAKDLRLANQAWTRSEIRSVVRAIITDVIGVEEFGDDDDFITDIGAG